MWSAGTEELVTARGLQAGHIALDTCTSWSPYAAMSGSSTEIITMIHVCYHTIAFTNNGILST